MIIQLHGWKTTGLRCPDTEIQFDTSNNISSINLIQMPNGTGKSTIIELIEAAMTGNGRNWGNEHVMEFNNMENPSDFGSFELHLSLTTEEHKNRRITFQLDFDFEVGTVTYSTLRDIADGLIQGWEPPSELFTFLDENCVEVFVFKGDKVDHLLDKNRSDAEKSIKAFFGLSKIDELCDHIEDDFQKMNTGNIRSPHGHTKKEKLLEAWIIHKRVLKEREKELELELKPLRKQFDELSLKVEKIMSGQSGNAEKKEKYKSNLENSKNSLDNNTKKALDALRNPFFVSKKISLRLNELHDNLEKFKLPGTSSVFFEELCQAESCICDRDMNDEAKAAIAKNSAGFLSDDQINIVNGIKRDVIKYTTIADENQGKAIFDELNDSIMNYNANNNTYLAHLAIMEEEASKNCAELMDNYKDLLGDINKKDALLKFLRKTEGSYHEAMEKSPKDCKQIPIIEKIIETLEEDLAKATDTMNELHAKNMLINVLKKASENALSKLKLEIRDNCNDKLKSIIPEGDWLEVKEIDKNIKLGFGDKLQSRGSGGQNVAVAYSFATSILERSGAEFPLIVDHPVTALMERARKELGKKLSKICHQFVGFIIDTEKKGFVESLKANTDSVKYITMFKKITANEVYLSLLPNDKSKVFESSNGIVCTDQEFFDNFEDIGDAEED